MANITPIETARERYLAERADRRPPYVKQLERELAAVKAERDALQTGLEALKTYALLPKFYDALTVEEERYHHPYIHRDDVLLRLAEVGS